MAMATSSSSTCSNSTPTPTAHTAAVSNGAWQGDNPLHFALPLLILQICLVLFVTRTLASLLRPLRQPRVIAEIIGGILLGPSALGCIAIYKNNVFPPNSITVLDTIANLGLMFFLFLVGLELDLDGIRKTGKQALSIAAAGISVPFVASIGVTVVLHKTIAAESRFAPLLVFMGVAMSITAFPVLARILAERKLLMLELGQTAMSAAAVNDVMAWILLALAVAISSSGERSPLVAVWVLLCGVAFLVVMLVVVRPIFMAMARKTDAVDERYVAMVMVGMLAAGFATDAIGIHVIFGSFVTGLIVPKDGPLAVKLVEKVEDMVTILMLPLYFASSGLKTDIGAIQQSARSVGLLLLVIATACAGKVLGTFAVANYGYKKMGVRKSLTLGFLMNTKGLVELIVLNIGKEKKVLNDETFAIMVLMALFTTFITTPVVMALYKPARDPKPYGTDQRRMLASTGQKPPSDGELRVLACVHGTQSIHAILNLVDVVSRGRSKKRLHLYVLHLLQLTERPSSIMRLQQQQQVVVGMGQDDDDLPCDSTVDSTTAAALVFQTYGQLSKVKLRFLTAVSNLEDMHEEVCRVSEERRAAFIILPFHKHTWPGDGARECHDPEMEDVNHKVVRHAPCSVGILVDRGIGCSSSAMANRSTSTSSTRSCSSTSSHDHEEEESEYKVAVLYVGGPDDRESLAFACRMAENPRVKVKVYRLVLLLDYGAREEEESHHASSSNVVHPTPMSLEDLLAYEERKLDEDCLASIKMNRASSSIEFEEKVANNLLEAATEIAEIKGFSVLIMGRGRQHPPLMFPAEYFAGKPAAQNSQLGPLADAIIANCSNTTHSSILVIQQYCPAESSCTNGSVLHAV